MITHHKIEVTKTADIYILGDIKSSNKILIALHGYGQLAKYFANKFEPLIELGYSIVVPEGLSKFYIKGTSGRVGASWMTKEERESDIRDYISYIKSIPSKLNIENKQIALLGFSQGGATAQRCFDNNTFNKLLLCSSSINDDYKFNTNAIYICGNNDEYINKSKLEEYSMIFDNSIIFEGKHEVNIESIKKGLQL